MSTESKTSLTEASPETPSISVENYGDTLVLLRNISEELSQQNQQNRRQISLLRGCLIAAALAALVCIVVAVALVPPAFHLLTDVTQAVEAIDMQKIDLILAQTDALVKEGNLVISSAGSALSSINALDFDSLNAAILSLKDAAEGLTELDIGMLNEAIENLNSAIAPLAKFAERFR